VAMNFEKRISKFGYYCIIIKIRTHPVFIMRKIKSLLVNHYSVTWLPPIQPSVNSPVLPAKYLDLSTTVT
jgi:hypothetical protein